MNNGTTSFFDPQLGGSRLTRSINPFADQNTNLIRSRQDHIQFNNFQPTTTFRDGSVREISSSFGSAQGLFSHHLVGFAPCSSLPKDCFPSVLLPLNLDGNKNESVSFFAPPLDSVPTSASSLCIVRALISTLPNHILESLQEKSLSSSTSCPSVSSSVVPSSSRAPSPTFSQETSSSRTSQKRQRDQSAFDAEDFTPTKKRYPTPEPTTLAGSESPTTFVAMESPKLTLSHNPISFSSNHSPLQTHVIDDSLPGIESQLHIFFDDIAIKTKQQHAQSKSDLANFLGAAFGNSAKRLCKSMNSDIDQVVGKSTCTSTCPNVEQLSASIFDSDQTLDMMHDKFILHTLEELKFLSTNIICSSSSAASSSRTTQTHSTGIHKVLVFLLYVLVCRFSRTIFLVDLPENRSLRNWAMSVFFRSMLQPPASLSSSFPDSCVLGKIGLAKLDAKQKKIPRDVVEAVLRPALQHFCQLHMLDLKLIVGLRSVVELFPTLFKEVFGRKILETLESLADPKVMEKTFAEAATPQEIRAMILHMLDFFQLFASTKAFACDQWISRIAMVVVRFEEQFPSKCDADSKLGCCQGFRTPLCRLLCIYPAKGVSVMLEFSANHCLPQRQRLTELFRSIMKCKRALPLVDEFKIRSNIIAGLNSSPSTLCNFVCNKLLSDVTLLVGASRTPVSAHRVVLASKSHFFHQLFTNGFAETHQSEIALEDVSGDGFDVVIRYMYDNLPQLNELSAQVVFDSLRLADRFGLEELQTMCEQQLSTMIDLSNWRVVLDFAASVTLPQQDNQQQQASQKQKRICSFSSVLAVDRCGDMDCGVLLRACKAFVLSNLHALTEELADSDTLLFDLLSANPDISG
eukprot:c2276_g1_i1.p1 GENE.c2276_g1_i1~~c2276_g1_i1.p1  ORF type:complete len:858 (-),score=182.97 c2276_g1_i1:514-3087(-)